LGGQAKPDARAAAGEGPVPGTVTTVWRECEPRRGAVHEVAGCEALGGRETWGEAGRCRRTGARHRDDRV